MHEERTYRDLMKTDDLVKFEVIVKETDLLVRAESDLSKETRESVLKYRHQLETYIMMNPGFQQSLVPLAQDPYAPEIVKQMIQTSQWASVGPMATVAGAMADLVSRDLLNLSTEVIVENGGDIYLASSKERTIGIYAGDSPLSLKIGIVISPDETPLGVCTSSGTVGPSLSFGMANAVCILSKSAALADAAATAVGNVVKEKKNISLGLGRAREIEGVLGTLIIVAEKMGVWGKIKLTRL
ncbi:MAG: thiamine biosynthesis protein ApbE [Deltaproteobacteria bacterium RBG_16_48_10]|nr:MAG: thiamine biosynthesis protein ApbE [Deltaproteobacteria bacterium RBG_16_48_10]